ncbi:hypothetical protein M8818_004360 [Zalaria obscura]|uniref:Uncharacterized protein n=1 Tax=Zalaria obscura TaxID=2024903 RepID=A0ACC3SAX2_9PEZI
MMVLHRMQPKRYGNHDSISVKGAPSYGPLNYWSYCVETQPIQDGSDRLDATFSKCATEIANWSARPYWSCRRGLSASASEAIPANCLTPISRYGRGERWASDRSTRYRAAGSLARHSVPV